MQEVVEKKSSEAKSGLTKKGTMTPPAAAIWRRLRENQTWAGHGELSLMLHLSRIGRVASNEMETATNISLPQLRILFEAMAPEGVSQATLHKHYQVDPGSITRTVQGMERDGLVTRQVDENDNRLMRVYITDKGREMAEEMPARLAAFERAVTADLSDEEVRLFHSLLERLESRLYQVVEENQSQPHSQSN